MGFSLSRRFWYSHLEPFFLVLTGLGFYDLLGGAEILGPFSPLP